MDHNDEFACLALGFKVDHQRVINPNHHLEISVRYSNDQLLRIFKTLGRFDHPLTCLESFGLKEDNPETRSILETLTQHKPDVVLEIVRDDIDQRKQKAK